MKTIVIVVQLAVMINLLAYKASAQDSDTSHVSNYRIGLAITTGRHGADWGFGLEVTSCLIGKYLFLRAAGAVHELEIYNARTDHWASYQLYSVKIGYSVQPAERIRVYAEAGVFTIVPERCYSKSAHTEGVTGMVGAELFFRTKHPPLCYFFSLGLSGTGTKAEILDGAPRYGSGLTFNNGLRFYFQRK